MGRLPASAEDRKKGALDVHPDRRTRKQHLQVIHWFAHTHGDAAATRYWLGYCPRISKAAATKAMRGEL